MGLAAAWELPRALQDKKEVANGAERAPLNDRAINKIAYRGDKSLIGL